MAHSKEQDKISDFRPQPFLYTTKPYALCRILFLPALGAQAMRLSRCLAIGTHKQAPLDESQVRTPTAYFPF